MYWYKNALVLGLSLIFAWVKQLIATFWGLTLSTPWCIDKFISLSKNPWHPLHIIHGHNYQVMWNYFSVECSQIRAVSKNNTLLPPEDIVFSSYLRSYMDISSGWCAATSIDSLRTVTLTFTEPLYLFYVIARGHGSDYVSEFSITYENSSGEHMTYVTVDGMVR